MGQPNTLGRGSLVVLIRRRGQDFRAVAKIRHPRWAPPPQWAPERADRPRPDPSLGRIYYEALDDSRTTLYSAATPDRTGVLIEVLGRESGPRVRMNPSETMFRLQIPNGLNASFIRIISEAHAHAFAEGQPTEVVIDLRGIVVSSLPRPDARVWWSRPERRAAALTIFLAGEGYTSDEESAFAMRCQELADLVAGLPWLSGAPEINFAAVLHPSVMSGTTYFNCHGKNTIRDTYYESSYGNFFDCDILAGDTAPQNRISIATDATVYGAEASLVLVNSSEYGGSSDGAVAWFPANYPNWTGLALHELGHQLGLRDETDQEAFGFESADVAGPNVSSEPLNPPWLGSCSYDPPRRFANPQCTAGLPGATAPPPDAGEIGAFQGAGYSPCLNFRPQVACRMRDVDCEFCLVCQNAIIADLSLRAAGNA